MDDPAARNPAADTADKRAERRRQRAAETGADRYPDSPDMAWLNWPDPGLAGYLRCGMRVMLFALNLLLCVPLYYLWRILGLSNPWPRTFLKNVAWICGARVRVHGTPLRRNVFFISNHLSWLDIPIVGGRNGSAFVSQDGVRDWPIVGWLCTMNNTIFVSRTNRMGIAEQINQLSAAMETCWAVTIFPEGTTSDGLSLLPFKSPLLKVLNPPPAGILVQPVYIDYGEKGRQLAWLGQESAINNAWRVFSRKGSFPLNLHFLEPFDPRDFPNRKAIAAEARGRIETALQASLTAEASHAARSSV